MLADNRLPDPGTPVPLRREHRLYQADWLMRYYGFNPGELVTEDAPWLDLEVDPKLAWALRNIDKFPLEVMDACTWRFTPRTRHWACWCQKDHGSSKRSPS